MATLGIDIERGLFLGIDFGTTNSVVSIYDFKDGDAETIPIDGSNIFPTAIQFEQDLEDENKLSRVFGIQAKEAAIIYPESTVLSVKRLFASDDKVNVTVEGEEYSFTPEEVASEIIGYLKTKADEYVQEELGMSGEFTGCVVTVPANSTDKQKKKTMDAVVKAGFDPDSVYLRLEPAAAAISYAVNERNNKKILVYDFGGGTFDACILEIKTEEAGEPEISILSTYGDNDLGGNDIDKIIVDMIYEEFKKLTDNEIDLFDFNADDGVSVRQKKIALVRLQQVANQTKERLSHSKSAKVVLAPFIQEPKIVNINMEISRDDFTTHKRINKLGDSDEIFEKFQGKDLHDIINRTLECIDDCIKVSGLAETDIDEIFLVGGSSSIGLIGEKIKEKFNKEPYKSKISPALSISQGAAYYCGMIMMPTVKGPVMHESTIHPIGLELSGRRFMEIVKAGMIIPKDGLTVDAEELLTTNFDNVSSMAIVVYENCRQEEIKYVNEEGMKRLAGTTLRGIPQQVKGVEKVKVSFFVGQDNMLKVTAQSTSDTGVTTELSVDELYS